MIDATRSHRRTAWVATGCMLALVLAASGPAFAQAGGPFGIGAPEAGSYGSATGILGWITTWQSEFYQGLKEALKAMRSDPHAAWLLVGLSFGYGIFHAAGPGHGKAVIASYVIANRQTLRRGIALSFVSALFQGIVAIGFVGAARFIFNVTAVQMSMATEQLELTSALMITALGLYLIATKVLRLRFALPRRPAALASAGPAGTALFGAGHAHDANCNHLTLNRLGPLQGRVTSPAAMVCADCGHMPDPSQLMGDFSWRKAFGAIAAVGVRPCSGAIIVLVFAFSQRLYAAGMLSVMAMALGTGITVAALASLAVTLKDRAVGLAGSDSVWGTRVVRTAEILASFAVLAMGSLLLAATLSGYGGAG